VLGVIFLLIGIRFVFEGVRTMTVLRGPVEHIEARSRCRS
jgi:hypothetical protein